ncbi:putative secreted protein [Streptomyces davaonensis JCM 4913]|uniref:Putative secreted protein n=1 Tax=Streptomyces davaonensis (strain DSM 101723 / JCM 4913 / KCC S-0913 / 768) TaxID=1214101 RepID=K4RDM2_STRDJ|nr:putative secreted protein [Streptomyces davaonensis JCM 4913]
MRVTGGSAGRGSAGGGCCGVGVAAGVGSLARACGVPLRPPVPPQRHDYPQLGGLTVTPELLLHLGQLLARQQ